MKKILLLVLFAVISLPSIAQLTLSLDSCRAMALRNNNQLNATKLKYDMATDVRKAARTNYLPKIDAVGGYEYFSKEISLLSDERKNTFSNLGTGVTTKVGTDLNTLMTGLAQKGLISPVIAQDLGNIFERFAPSVAQLGDAFGQQIVDAFDTDTRNIWTGAVVARQPIYMGGAIVAANKMAGIAEKMAASEIEGMTQTTIYDIDKTYWFVVSLKQKQKLAHSYLELVQKLNEDVHKLIDEGLATRADGLTVDVKVNEAEMQVIQVEDGLVLAKMLLCQLCGIPATTEITLADEDNEMLNMVDESASLAGITPENRTELKLLEHAVELSKQSTNLTRAAYLPHVALTGGYMISNPNLFNGFEKEFSGVWNVGVLVQVPIWNWFEGVYKVRASKTATNIARLEMQDAKEKIDLQVEQSRFKVNEAKKRLQMATKNVANAEENLRCANVGFREGVMESTEVMAAQTAWQMAKSMKIDAEIEVKLAQVNLKKALGILE